jgi:hypothetical protein
MNTRVDPTARSPMNQGTLNTRAVPDIFTISKSSASVIDTYRLGHDRAQSMADAADKLRYQPNGSAVIVTEWGKRWGDSNFGGVHYDKTTVGEAQSVDSAIRQINGLHLTAPNDVFHSYIVYKDDGRPTDTGGVHAIPMEEVNRMR